MKNNLTHYYVSFIFLIILLTANFLLWQLSRNYVANVSRATFNERVVSYAKNTSAIIRDYMNIPIYGAAFITHSEEVKRNEFEHFFRDVLSRRGDTYTAVKAVAFVQNVTDTGSFVNEVKADKSLSLVGYPFFSIFPNTEEKTAYAINYLVPFDENKSLFGYNLASDPKQAEVIRESIILHEPRATEKLIVLNASRITVYNPVFTQGSKGGQLKGFIAMILDPDVLFDQLTDTQNSGITASLYNGKKNLKDINSITANNITSPKDHLFQSVQYVEIAKQPFTILYTSEESSQQTFLQKIVPQLLLYGGSGIIFLLFMTINYIFFSNENGKEWSTTKEKN